MEQPLDQLIKTLARLPGLGQRSAERAALALVRRPDGLMRDLQQALEVARNTVCCCRTCGGFTVTAANPCKLCSDERRDSSQLCIVEEPGDIMALERAGVYSGRYHALLGKVSATRATGPEDLRLKALVERLNREPIRELILALSTDLEGDATAAYLNELLRNRNDLRITRLAFGLPADSGVRYSDPLTLKRALGGRRDA